MVRLKQRYLLLDILYPDPSTWPPTSQQNQPAHRIHAPTADTLTPALLAKLIRDQVSELFGDWGVGRLGGVNAGGVSVKYLSPATSTAIIRCPRASYRLVWMALSYITHVPEFAAPGSGPGKRSPLTRPCVFRVVKVSGTMRRVEEEAIRRARREISRAASWVGVGDGDGDGDASDTGDVVDDTGDVMDVMDEED